MFDTNKNTDELFSALQHLKHNKHEIILFHVIDKQKEIDFDYKNRPSKFIDLESGEIIKLNPVEIRKQYKKSIKKFVDELKLRCGNQKIDFVEADINKGFEQILLPYLLKRKKMK